MELRAFSDSELTLALAAFFCRFALVSRLRAEFSAEGASGDVWTGLLRLTGVWGGGIDVDGSAAASSGALAVFSLLSRSFTAARAILWSTNLFSAFAEIAPCCRRPREDSGVSAVASPWGAGCESRPWTTSCFWFSGAILDSTCCFGDGGGLAMSRLIANSNRSRTEMSGRYRRRMESKSKRRGSGNKDQLR